jgi:hypothetical protein
MFIVGDVRIFSFNRLLEQIVNNRITFYNGCKNSARSVKKLNQHARAFPWLATGLASEIKINPIPYWGYSPQLAAG